MGGYEQGKARLVARVRQANQPWNPTSLSKEIDAFANRLNALAQDLKTSSGAGSAIEYEHNRQAETDTGLDGWPIEPVSFDISYDGILFHMEALAESAKRASEGLPNSRTRQALPFAALGILLLRHENGFSALPRLTNDSPEVLELGKVCNEAGIYLAPETYRNALSAALKIFDPQFIPFEYRIIVLGRLT